ncbi:MAG: ribosome modulation factor [Pseudomonadales bacterium]|nr:ribosome modulation factor [Pseudomonadales bacterium]
MRRQKRDKHQRAFTRGYHIGMHGKSKDLCPYHESEARQAWLTGWRNGREDNWDGYVGTAGVSKSPLS